ncbi:hypothetical protein [uncultured Draconibacterium sp.]|uniref:hypothetical protein n=2 Tax=uncultured Draconibacterium sp. TaxID=1573823 RepID=UPI00374A8A28
MQTLNPLKVIFVNKKDKPKIEIMESVNLAFVFGVNSLFFLVWNFVVSLRIMRFLKARGEKANPATMHVYLFESAKKYRKFSKAESGMPGKYYAPFWLSILFFALFLFLGILCVLQNC